MEVSVFVPQYGTIEAITPAFRAFNTANDFLVASGRGLIFNVEYVGLNEYVPANRGEYTVRTNRLIRDVGHTDLLIIPPTFGDADTGIRANAEAIPHFNRLYKEGSILASLCMGAFLLAETGLLKGKKCSTHWAFIEEFKARYPDVEVEDGSVITEYENIYSSGGGNSLWNLVLYLLEKFSDRETAIMISKYFALDIGRNSQSQFAIFKGQKNHGDKDIQLVQEFIENNYENKITIGELASHINIARRTFERRFKEATNNTTIEYLQRVRIEAAKKLFESSRKNVSEVMYGVGYTDTKAFRDTFKKVTGLTPIEYKNRFAKLASEECVS